MFKALGLNNVLPALGLELYVWAMHLLSLVSIPTTVPPPVQSTQKGQKWWQALYPV